MTIDEARVQARELRDRILDLAECREDYREAALLGMETLLALKLLEVAGQAQTVTIPFVPTPWVPEGPSPWSPTCSGAEARN